MICDLETSIPDWIIEHPETTAIFNELKLDVSCGGKSLEYVAMQQGLNPHAVMRRLREVIDTHGTST